MTIVKAATIGRFTRSLPVGINAFRLPFPALISYTDQYRRQEMTHSADSPNQTEVQPHSRF
ncbi:hypothetical protein C6558_15220 [Ensifer sp. NM-2]|nr:hypothetical protein C6558_15220 [Ensifer sp. NM-2]